MTDNITGRVGVHRDEFHRKMTWKTWVRAASTANGTLASAFENGDTLDGVTLATGDRILLKDQTAGAENGIYTVNASGAPTRAYDMDTAEEVIGAMVEVIAGTANAGKVFRNTNTSAPTLGTTTLNFTEFAPTVTGFTDPMTTRGDIIARNASNVTDRLAHGAANTYLGSDGTDVSYSAVTDAKLSTSDITTNNVSTSKHGFAPKGDGNAAHYLDGTGAYSTPSGGGASWPSVPTMLNPSETTAGNAQNPSLTITAAASGHRLIVGVNLVGRGVTSITCTNTTFTQMFAGTSTGGSHYEIWVGVVSGGSSGTSITVNTASSNFATVTSVEVADTLTPTAGTSASGNITVPLTAGSIVPFGSLTGTTAGRFVAMIVGFDDTTKTTIAVPWSPAAVWSRNAASTGLAMIVGYSTGGAFGGNVWNSNAAGGFWIGGEIT